MTWNYRIVKRGEDEEIFYGVYEVYYNENGEPYLVTEDPINLQAETVEELVEDMTYISKAFEESILTYEDFEER